MAISGDARVTLREEAKQPSTFRQNISTAWRKHKVSIITTAIGGAAVVGAGSIALAAMATEGVAIPVFKIIIAMAGIGAIVAAPHFTPMEFGGRL